MVREMSVKFGKSVMPGTLTLAFKLLVNDRAKFMALLIGITFAVFLMVQMTSMFAGVLSRASATVLNIGAKVWVMDPAVNNVSNSIGMPDYVIDFARSIDGVKFAVATLLRRGAGENEGRHFSTGFNPGAR